MTSSHDLKLASSATAHRLPTVNASQALQALKARGSQCIPTGLSKLDTILRPSSIAAAFNNGGGIARGQITEIYGPPGVGKTTFALQICVNALKAGQGVVWIDAAVPLTMKRFDDIHLSSKADTSQDARSKFHQYFTPSLAHFLALILHPPNAFPPNTTSLLVVDSLSTLFDTAYSRNNASRPTSNSKADVKWSHSRRPAHLMAIMAALQKTASLHNIAVVLTCQTVTRMRPGAGAVLLPALSSQEWDAGLTTKLVLFRDWAPIGLEETEARVSTQGIRYVGLEKVPGNGNGSTSPAGKVFPFVIEQQGLVELASSASDATIQNLTSPIARPPKRGYTEIADSEDDADSDDTYGWADEDTLAAEGLVVNETSLDAEAVHPNGPGE